MSENLKLLISRLLEANAVRDILIDPDKLRSAINEDPALIETLRATVDINKVKFSQHEVEPYSLSQLGHINQTIERSTPDELDQISTIAIFLLEREIFEISKRILDNQ